MEAETINSRRQNCHFLNISDFKEFIWNGKKAKINNKTLCNKFHGTGLQKVDIQSKIEALQLSWIKRLKDEHEQQWKQI